MTAVGIHRTAMSAATADGAGPAAGARTSATSAEVWAPADARGRRPDVCGHRLDARTRRPDASDRSLEPSFKSSFRDHPERPPLARRVEDLNHNPESRPGITTQKRNQAKSRSPPGPTCRFSVAELLVARASLRLLASLRSARLARRMGRSRPAAATPAAPARPSLPWSAACAPSCPRPSRPRSCRSLSRRRLTAAAAGPLGRRRLPSSSVRGSRSSSAWPPRRLFLALALGVLLLAWS